MDPQTRTSTTDSATMPPSSTSEPKAEVAAPPAVPEVPWGRVIIAGGTDWLRLGKKEKPAGSDDLSAPYILRAISHVKVVKAITSGSAAHAVFIDNKGNAHFVGRNTTSAFGILSTSLPFSPHPSLKPSPASRTYPSDIPLAHKIYARILPGATAETTIVDGAVGRGHTILIGSEGEVWVAGRNDQGQCGVGRSGDEVGRWEKVEGNWGRDGAKVVQASAGLNFSLFLADNGRVYACGSGEHGQLGNGVTGERIITAGKTGFDVQDYPTLIKPFTPAKIIQIASGHNHSLAMSEDGYVWAWGFAGYGRLGTNDQKDRLVPNMVPAFSSSNIMTRARAIGCGPSCSVVVDRQKMYQIAGRWKVTGEGSSGSPYMSFKYVQDVMSCKVLSFSSGGNAHFLVAPADQNDVMCVGFGQGCANAELGLGPNQPKNATKPTRIETLNGIDVIAVGASAYTTFWIAHPRQNIPDDPLSALPRWPEDLDTHDICLICDTEKKKEMPLECERCENPFHGSCLSPPLETVPEGEWLCNDCVQEGEQESPSAQPAMSEGRTTPKGKGTKRKAEDSENGSQHGGRSKAGASKKRK